MMALEHVEMMLFRVCSLNCAQSKPIVCYLRLKLKPEAYVDLHSLGQIVKHVAGSG